MTLDQKNNATAWVVTVVFHILLLLLFFLIKYSIPATPIVEELGMEVNLGTSEDGYGFEQPEWVGDPSALESSEATTDMGSEDAISTYTSSTGEEVIPTSRPRNNVRSSNVTQGQTVTQPTTAAPRDPRYSYQNMQGQGGNTGQNNVEGGAEGITSGPGDQGNIDGTVGAENYEGGQGKGNMRHNFSKRTIVRRPDPNATFDRGGTVSITLTVNSNGEILPGYRIDAPNAQLRRLAEEKLKQIRFNQVNPGPPEAGIIYFDFKVGQ